MDKYKRWTVIRGRMLIIVGVASLLVAMFMPDQIPAGLAPLVVVFGVGFIALSIPWRVWNKLPAWFHRDDTWL
ncbi:MAG: hypothetical protein HOC27_00935 [Phycisphaerae bacterium]|jgi:hypothetical protein|nr:hypothetical protein [Phycisphaerae bacterium]